MDGKGLLTFKIHSQGKEVLLDVTDTGKGMDEDKYKEMYKDEERD